MKRAGNLYNHICSIENLQLADAKARKGKHNQPAIKEFDRDTEGNLQVLHEQLVNKRYKTSAYHIFTIQEPKERIIYRLPYIDRVVHHAILNPLERIFTAMYTADTYSCIKKRGIHGAQRKVCKALLDVENTTYCLKLDIRKFYPTVDHDVLKQLLRRKFKDNDLLGLLDGIIDSAPGLPIGNYLSQHLANFYLSGFDHWLKEVKGVKYYFRYADDIVILHKDKAYLHQLLADIKQYLADNLKLEVKGNYQVFPVKQRGIDFVGYVFRHRYVRIRKRIKQNFARMLKRRYNPQSIAAYDGFLKHANTKHLKKKLLTNGNKLQRPKIGRGRNGVYRGQTEHETNFQQGDMGTCFQDNALHKKRRYQVPLDANINE